MFCGGLCCEGSMVYVGIHIKRIAMDLREAVESKAECFFFRKAEQGTILLELDGWVIAVVL